MIDFKSINYWLEKSEMFKYYEIFKFFFFYFVLNSNTFKVYYKTL